MKSFQKVIRHLWTLPNCLWMLLWKWIQPIVHHQSATIYGNVTPMGFLTLIVTKPTPNLRQRILLSISATNKSLSYPQFYCTITLPQITLTKTDRNGNRFGSIEIKLYFFTWYSIVFSRVSKWVFSVGRKLNFHQPFFLSLLKPSLSAY